MKKYRQALTALLVLIFADVAADPLQPVVKTTPGPASVAASETAAAASAAAGQL